MKAVKERKKKSEPPKASKDRTGKKAVIHLDPDKINRFTEGTDYVEQLAKLKEESDAREKKKYPHLKTSRERNARQKAIAELIQAGEPVTDDRIVFSNWRESLITDVTILRNKAELLCREGEYEEGHPDNIKHYTIEFGSIVDECYILGEHLKADKLGIISLLDIDGRYDYQMEKFSFLLGHLSAVRQSTVSEGLRELRELREKQKKRLENYRQGPGAFSKIIGEESINRAKKVLAKVGGIQGYDKLQHGGKKLVRNEIEMVIRAKDERNIYNILNKIRNQRKEN